MDKKKMMELAKKKIKGKKKLSGSTRMNRAVGKAFMSGAC